MGRISLLLNGHYQVFFHELVSINYELSAKFPTLPFSKLINQGHD